jgi:acyl-CoA synthetase (AMP-forming)/AMP-acid ligase II
MNISMFLQMAAETFPDRIALVNPEGRHSYGALHTAAQAAARLIKQSGCEYVALLDTSSEAVAIALMGAAIAGKPYVPLNYRLTDAELGGLVERITPAFAVVGEAHLARYPQIEGSVVYSRRAFLEAVSTDEEPFENPDVDPSAVAVQLFTSGTTGKPKAAILRHEHLVSYILGTVEFMSAEEDEATLVTVPPYHIAGISAVMSSIYACRRIVQLPDFTPRDWLMLAHREQVTNAFVVPTMLSRIIDDLKRDTSLPKPAALRAIAYGGGKMPVQVVQTALDLFPEVSFTNAYGLTETSSTIALLDPDDHRAAYSSEEADVRKRLGSVGRPLPGVEIEIRDDEGRVCGPNEAGEVYVRGPQVSGEYLERNALVADGWFPTRDSGYLDEGGYLFLSGRADDVIVRGGENISPAEIEDVLLSHGDVIDAAVVAIPSVEWGETVGAAVVLSPGTSVDAGMLQAMVKNALRSSRVPEKVLFVDALPYNETGKLLRRIVKTYFV